jgi:hypothetical protein
MVSDDPESFADLDGHAGDSISTIIQDAVLTAIGTWASDNILGALRPNPETFGGKMGQAIGDFAAQQSGIAEAEAGASLTPPALALAGGGQVEALAVPAGLVAHGTATAGIATINLAKDAAETTSSSKPSESSSDTVHGAQREAMRQEGVPTSQQPEKQVSTKAGRQYTYEVSKPGGGKETKIVTRQHADQNHGTHVEAGSPKANGQTDPSGRLRHKNDKTKVNVNE